MKTNVLVVTVVGVVTLACSTAVAELFDRGSGLIYDDDLNITWLQDASFAKTSGFDVDGRLSWSEARAWVEALSFRGFDDWRLPMTNAEDTSCYYPIAVPGGVGYNCTQSEMGHLYYRTLGNLPSTGPNGNPVQGYGPVNVAPFIGIAADGLAYWSKTEGPDTGTAYAFGFANGIQVRKNVGIEYYVWAVRDGDVIATPEPGSLALLAVGLAGLVMVSEVVRRRSRLD